ncbi:uncharacterized protein LOC119980626 isoform X2 [Tripterygium wilfordii]|nr:uncharacterized protein LOC119980626 isoform X2 [Tripterygium wilfordii]XP_038679336.1 uncharacterized protein LOC119980626 isoform X2 [Tripterygium wilfordii]
MSHVLVWRTFDHPNRFRISQWLRISSKSGTVFYNMSHRPKMGDEVKFQQRWEFRRADDGFDSSCDDSKSSSGSPSVLKKHKMVSKLISPDNDESSDASRPQQKEKDGPGFRVECGNGKAVQSKKRKKDNLPNNAVKRGSRNDAKKKKSKASAYEPALLGDIKNFMESLLEDLKVTTKSLFSWMKEEIHKLEADDVGAQPERRGSGVGSIHLQQQNLGENNHLQHQNHIAENIKKRHCSNKEENIPLQQLKDLKSCTRAQNSNGRLSQRRLRRRKAVQSNNCDETPENQVNFASAEKDKGGKQALTVRKDIQSTRSDQNDTMQHQKSVVLAIGAQNSYGSRKGKKAVNLSNHYEVPEDGDCQIVGSMKPTERKNGDKLGLSSDPKFSSYTSCQVASSMYLTLPSVLTEPLLTNHSVSTSSCNNTQQRNYGNEAIVNAIRASPILDSSTQPGYLSAVRPVERIGDLVQMVSGGSFHTNLNSSPGSGILHYGVNSGFNTPSQVSLESLSRGNNNLMGLRMNGGGAIRNLRGSYALPEYYTPNVLHNYSSYRADDRLVAFQSSDHKDGCRLPK